MSATTASQRCPRCGNENRGENFQCSFCGKRLRLEGIENIFLFRRTEMEWTNPARWYVSIIWLFVNPSKCFWSINHKRDKAPGFLILLFNALLFGLLFLAFFFHFRITSIEGVEPAFLGSAIFIYGLAWFLACFLFGLIFYFIFFSILIWMFTKGANYAVGFSERLETRFGSETGKKKKKKAKIDTEMSPFSIYKGGTLMQKQESHKKKMMMCAFAPFLLINVIKIIISLALPYEEITINSTSLNTTADLVIFERMFNSPIWGVFDFLDAITIAIWIPILMTIAIRELANCSTYKVLISSLIVGLIISIFYYFTRPTLFGGLA